MDDSGQAKASGKLKSDEKAQILAFQEAGMSSMQIASRMGHHRASIDRLLQKAKVNDKNGVPPHKKGSGRPRKVTNLLENIIKRAVTNDPTLTAPGMKHLLPELANISLRTINHVLLKRLKIPSRVAAMKPLLTAKMKQKRLNFAKAYSHFTPEDWSKVMYSDESTFRCLRATRTKVRRPVGSNRFESKFTVKTVKHPSSVMVWGCFSVAVGRGGIYFLPQNTTMNGDRYKVVLEEHLIRYMNSHGCTHFLHDGAPCHAAKKIKDFLAQYPFEIINWPGNSPDLNPIENCWNFMKNELRKKDISSVPKLIDELKSLWTSGLSHEYLKKLSDSMPRRMQMVIQAKGDMTKY